MKLKISGVILFLGLLAGLFSPAVVVYADWTGSGPGDISVVIDRAQSQQKLSYTLQSDEAHSTQTWDFHDVAQANRQVELNYLYEGYHAFYQAQVFLHAYVTHNGTTTTTTVFELGPTNYPNYPSGGFSEKGSVTLNVQVGDTYGFKFGGRNFDSDNRLMGTITTSELPLYSSFYYLPYFVNNADYATGLAIRNSSETDTAETMTQIYSQDGALLSTAFSDYPPQGQGALVVGKSLNTEGWLKVSSTTKLTGLAFVAAVGSAEYMYDITFVPESKAAQVLHVPHVAQDQTWTSTVFVNNPNFSAVTVTLTFFNSDGVAVYSEDYNIPGNGAIKVAVADLVQGSNFDSGSIEISATQPVTAFGLYNNLDSGGGFVAGISAVDPNDQ